MAGDPAAGAHSEEVTGHRYITQTKHSPLPMDCSKHQKVRGLNAPRQPNRILDRANPSSSNMQGGSPVCESRTPGSVRGVLAMSIPTGIA
jgi:hypothetical protein